MTGPITRPTYSDSERRLTASPVRPGGARSAPAASAATRNAASATPSIVRAATRIGSVVATRWRPSARTVSSAPMMSSGRRPWRSADQPTTGRAASDAKLQIPIARPKPKPSARIGPATKRGETGRITPLAVKNTSDDANTAMNAGPNRRWSDVRGVATALVVEQAEEPVGAHVRIQLVARDRLVDFARRGRVVRRAQPLPDPRPQDRRDLGLRPRESRVGGGVLRVGCMMPVERGEQLRDSGSRRGGGHEHVRALWCRA